MTRDKRGWIGGAVAVVGVVLIVVARQGPGDEIVSCKMLKRSALLIAFVFIGGCLNNGDSQLPAHFPAKGEITQDGKPVGAGFVRFHPSGNEEYTVDGEVDAFGKFELVTTLKDKKVKGAPPGTYSVTFTANADPKVKRAATKSSFQIEAKANDLTVELEERK